jgi:predicted amidohydrolase YtcJ
MALRSVRTRVIDLKGLSVVPGFHDAHIHFIWYGVGLSRVDLTESPSLQVALTRVQAAATPVDANAWIVGGGWNHDLWGGQFPSRQSLDAVTGTTPTVLRRKDGHSVWVNSAALARAGITRETPDPEGGHIHRDDNREPTGILSEHAIDLVSRLVPQPSKADFLGGLKAATNMAQSLGITSIHDMEGDDEFKTFQVQWHAGTLGVRVVMQLAVDTFQTALAVGVKSGQGDNLLRIGSLKIFSDGALGSRTAAMLKAYDGEPQNTGLMVTERPELIRLVSQAAANSIACAIHAIGDRANRTVLDVFEQTRHLWAPQGLRQRIEHAQLLTQSDVPRFARLGVIASMQPIHATQDMDAAGRYWGERCQFGYTWRSLKSTGAALAFGSDCPVETMDPLAGIYAAVSRRRADGTPVGGWYPNEAISVPEAVYAYTLGAAYAASVESSVGWLGPGSLADLAILSEDIFEPPHERILTTKVVATIHDGEVVYNQGIAV